MTDGLLVVVRFDATDDAIELTDRAETALGVLSRCRGFRSGWWGRSVDQPETWTLSTVWESVGAYRRALSSYDVKLYATPLMYSARDEVSAFEPILVAGPDVVRRRESDLAPDAGSANVGDHGRWPSGASS